MALTFRNLTLSPDDPVETWPTEAVHTALERGDLDDWRRLVAAVRRDPWGRTARAIEEVLTFDRPYGVAEVMESAIGNARVRCERAERDAVADEIRTAVDRCGLSRREVASRLGTSTSRLSTYVNGTVTPSAAFMVRLRRVTAPDS